MLRYQNTIGLIDYENSLLQKLVTKAYKETVTPEEIKKLDKVEFWSLLPLRIRVAVYLGNLNYQVRNGGFDQWVGNGYVVCSDELIPVLQKLPKIGPEIAAIVTHVAQKSKKGRKSSHSMYKKLDLDLLYYERETELLREIESLLMCCTTDEELSEWLRQSPAQILELMELPEFSKHNYSNKGEHD